MQITTNYLSNVSKYSIFICIFILIRCWLQNQDIMNLAMTSFFQATSKPLLTNLTFKRPKSSLGRQLETARKIMSWPNS